MSRPAYRPIPRPGAGVWQKKRRLARRSAAAMAMIEILEPRTLLAASLGTGLQATYFNTQVLTTSPITLQSANSIDNARSVWHFGEGTGTLARNATWSGDSRNGTLVNNPTWQTTGKVGGSLSFNGTDQYVTTGTWDIGNTFTISAWIYLPDPVPSNIRTIFANKASGSQNSGFAFYVNGHNTSNRRLMFETGNGTSSSNASSVDGAVPVGAGTHVAASFNRTLGKVRLYVNGQDVTQFEAIRTDFATNQENHIGCFASKAFYFQGGMDEVRVYAGSKTYNDVAHLYSNPSQVPDLTVMRRDAAVNFDWTASQSPAAGINAGLFGARWTGQIEAIEGGTYQFRITADEGVRLTIADGNSISGIAPVIDRWTTQQSGEATGTLAMEAGRKYTITLEYLNSSGAGSIKLEWVRPGQADWQIVPEAQLYPPPTLSGVGLPADYFSSVDLSGTADPRQDALIDFDWSGSPVTGAEASPFSVSWEGQLESIEAGTYYLQTYNDDGVRLHIGEVGGAYTTVIDRSWSAARNATYNTGAYTFQANRKYNIRLEYANHEGSGTMQLRWRRLFHHRREL